MCVHIITVSMYKRIQTHDLSIEAPNEALEWIHIDDVNYNGDFSLALNLGDSFSSIRVTSQLCCQILLHPKFNIKTMLELINPMSRFGFADLGHPDRTFKTVDKVGFKHKVIYYLRRYMN